MPELPEVETVRRGLAQLLTGRPRLVRVQVRQRDLRQMVPASLGRTVTGQRITAVRRRAKYLLLVLERHVLVNHLGMTGSWRMLDGYEHPRRHDHVLLHLEDGRVLAYADPRRFGLLDVVAMADLDRHPALSGLGPEPLGPEFTSAHLALVCSGRKTPIKALLLDQMVVAGIGNIYAAEACFRAGIDPRRPAGRLHRDRLQRLVTAIRTVLEESLAAGGSTISDYRQADGTIGRFQDRFRVYGRQGLSCPACATTLRGTTIAGRSTVWCPRCQA